MKLRATFAIFTSTLLATGIAVSSPTSASDPSSDAIEQPVFTVESVSGALTEEVQAALGSHEKPSPEQLGFRTLAVADQVAAVNHSLLRDGMGAVSSATPDYVDLSWIPMDGVATYAIIREEEIVATTESTSIRYKDVEPGETVNFRIVANVPESHEEFTPTYGLTVDVPKNNSSQRTAAEAQTVESADSAIYYSTSTIWWRTFIPDEKIDAPLAGCQYGSGYQFGGDDRGFITTMTGTETSRTSLSAWISWGRGESLGGPFEPGTLEIGSTLVYDSAGEVVDIDMLDPSEATAESRLLAIEEGYRTWADVRLSVQAGNPFCDSAFLGNSIAGAFTMHVTRTGNWMITSGSHRQMPNHEIVMSRTAGQDPQVHTPIYQKTYADPLCLVTWACPETQMGGLQGTY